MLVLQLIRQLTLTAVLGIATSKFPAITPIITVSRIIYLFFIGVDLLPLLNLVKCLKLFLRGRLHANQPFKDYRQQPVVLYGGRPMHRSAGKSLRWPSPHLKANRIPKPCFIEKMEGCFGQVNFIQKVALLLFVITSNYWWK